MQETPEKPRKADTAEYATEVSIRAPTSQPVQGPLVVSLDRTFDDFGFLSEQLRQVIAYIVRRQNNRMVRTRFVLEDTDRCPFAHAGV